MSRKHRWATAIAVAMMGALLLAPGTASAQNTGYVNGYKPRMTTLVRTTPYHHRYYVHSNWAYPNCQWTPYAGNYTVGFQVVYFWSGDGYVAATYSGRAGVRYPVLYR